MARSQSGWRLLRPLPTPENGQERSWATTARSFLVNRVLFPYFGGFAKLVSAGVDFVRIDKVMEKFGWPMGPAYLMDVVGIDTGHHRSRHVAEGFPDRMRKTDRRSGDRRALRGQAPQARKRMARFLRLRRPTRRAKAKRSGRPVGSRSARASYLRAAWCPTRTSSTG